MVNPADPDAPLLALIARKHEGKSLADLVRAARWRRARLAVAEQGEPQEAPGEAQEDNDNDTTTN